MWLSDVMCFIILRCYKSAFLCVFVYACKHLYIYVKLLMKYLRKSYLPGSDIWSSIFFIFLPLSLFSLGWKSNLHFFLMIQCKLEVITSNLNKCIEKSTWVFYGFFFYHWYDLSHLFQFDRGKVIIQRILNQIRTQFRLNACIVHSVKEILYGFELHLYMT